MVEKVLCYDLFCHDVLQYSGIKVFLRTIKLQQLNYFLDYCTVTSLG